MKKLFALTLATALLIAGSACDKKTPTTLEDHLQIAATTDKPLLIDFYADWCGPCQRFTKDSHEDSLIIAALDNVILFKTDCEKDAGIELAKKYGVRSYPTYVLVNASQETIARWRGYSKDYFISALNEELADLSTIEQKKARYTDQPTYKDASALARFSKATDMYKDAVDFYNMAKELNPDEDYSYDILYNTISGISKDEFTYEDAVRAAEKVFSGDDYKNQVYAANDMSKLAKRTEKMDEQKKYLERGIAAAAKTNDDNIESYTKELHIEYNLHFTGDKNKAVELKKTTYNDGWTEDSGQLNSFAWWCYENNVNLEEAEQLAIKAFNLAEPGRSRAMILDTAAHICKSLGNTVDAIKYMEMAVNEDPDDEGWKETLESFKADL